MGLSYLDNKCWQEITREERFFCSILYNYFSEGTQKAIKWINIKCELGLSDDLIQQDWELGFEVALYRDYLHYKGMEFKDKADRYRKRTFDLCFLSEKLIILIEAKAHGSINKKQRNDFKLDKNDITEVIFNNKNSTPDIKLLLLKSSHYSPSELSLGVFDGVPLNWSDLYKEFNEPLFQSADETYPHSSSKCRICNSSLA